MGRPWLALVHVALAASVASAGEAPALGPLEIAPLGPSLFFRETPAFLFPPPQAPGELRSAVTLNWLNYWLLNVEAEVPFTPGDDPATFPFEYGTFLVDMEALSLTPRLEWQAGRRVRLDVALPVVALGGGILDGLIEEFHAFLSVSNHLRELRPRGETGVTYVLRDGTVVAIEGDDLRGLHLGNAVAGLTVPLWQGESPANVRLAVSAPTASLDFLDTGGWDTTLQWTWSWCATTLCGYHGAGITHYGAEGDGFVELYSDRLSLMSAVEWRLSGRTSVLVQGLLGSPYADYPAIEEPVVELTFGFKKRLGEGVLEVGFVENLLFYDNSPDIGFHLAWSWSPR